LAIVGSAMAIQLNHQSRGLGEVVRLERQAFAAKVRIVRAVLGWSQTELGRRVGLTQRAIHKFEQGKTEPRRATVRALEEIWRDQNIEFEDLAEGGFRVSIHSLTLAYPARSKLKRKPS
jgi:transcriptional regulator with XRE-family HTH domain